MIKREFGIDSCRIIAAFLIITHHCDYLLLKKLESFYSVIGSWALFYFFVISGYFLSYKGNLGERSWKTISRILLISMIWTLIYLPVNITTYGWSNGIAYFLDNLLSNYYHLYFLLSLIIGFIYLNFSETLHFKKKQFVLSALLLLYYFLSTHSANYHQLLPFHLPDAIAPYFLGIPFILYGNHLANHPPLPQHTSFIFIISGLFLCLLEGILLKFNLHYIGGVFLVIGVVNIALHKPKFLDWGKISTFGGRYGLGIYLIHPLVIFLLLRLKIPNSIWKEILMPVIVMILSFSIFHGLYHLAPNLYQKLTGNTKLN